MGFDVFGATRHVQVSNIDDGARPQVDLFGLPAALSVRSPELERLNGRFYDSTLVRFAHGEVHRLRDELIELLRAYRAQREPELVKERGVRARDAQARSDILERVLSDDPTYRALGDFRLLCDEAIAAQADVRCEGD